MVATQDDKLPADPIWMLPRSIPGQLGIVLAVAPGHAPDILICWVGNCTLHTFNVCVIHMYVIHIVLIEISQHFANWWMKSKSLELSMHAFVALNIWLTRYTLEANAYLQNGRNYKTSNNLCTLWGNTNNAAPLIQWSRNPWRDFPVQRSPLSIFEAWNLGLDAHLQCCAKYMILSYFTLCMVSFR